MNVPSSAAAIAITMPAPNSHVNSLTPSIPAATQFFVPLSVLTTHPIQYATVSVTPAAASRKSISRRASHTTTIAQKQKISANLKTENRPKRRTVTRVRREFARRTGGAGLVVRAGGTGEACSSTSIGSDKGCSVMGSSAVVVIPRTQEVLRVRPAEGKHLRWNQVGTSEHLH